MSDSQRNPLPTLSRPDMTARVTVFYDAGCPLDRETLLARFHAQDEDGELVSGAVAFAAMWRMIPWLRPVGLAARFGPVRWLLERAYRLFLAVRPGLQKLISGNARRAPLRRLW